MTIVVTGAGSGGHITPVLAVAQALKASEPDIQVVYIGQKGDNLADIVHKEPAIDGHYAVSAGKFRRYHGEGWRQILDLKTMALNVRDAFRVLRGIWQSYWLLGRLKPSVVFIKGGFVGVPVGLMAALRRIPYVTHDSDAIPGLSNRIVARWASKHAVALPKELYSYPQSKTVTVGVPLRPEFQLVTRKQQVDYQRKLGITDGGRVLFVAGGGLGAQRLNLAITSVAQQLLQEFDNLHIIHQAGRSNQAEVEQLYTDRLEADQQSRVVVLGFAPDIHHYSGAADVVIMRAGATYIAEIAMQGKATILVPNPLLTGGHQLKNAEVLQKTEAAMLVSDDSLSTDLPLVYSTISTLLNDASTRRTLAANLHKLAHPHATEELTAILLEVAKRSE
ncbi:UDP-N-acetylglucosamine--N-acetylmuramyl-(pentapeptide) pyrophosphoryl-undecaprenol N-acetylglucosamine transferase [Candidatus Saccharibacteria bacterium]|nr:UDP-N-acetylglucosamine--N-acetylmuramyl-(pentapeptide) pyrophosphoryl-undecaprenol N-acetylglucosamine transferase [Candidatus Saccharibacteria bacterium]